MDTIIIATLATVTAILTLAVFWLVAIVTKKEDNPLVVVVGFLLSGVPFITLVLVLMARQGTY
jgi:RsiW-degrading membrane proteinase PrsW (M82 family)